MNGKIGGKYEFTITDENKKEISFEYYYNNVSKSVEIIEKKG